jgi:protein subunit release factor A
MLEKLEVLYNRFKEVEELISSPEILSDRKRATTLNK